MGIGDYLWPFQKKFSEIPCARETAIASMLGGIGMGATSIIVTNQAKYAYKTSIYAGFIIFWVAFINCRVQYERTKSLSQQFVDSVNRGEIE